VLAAVADELGTALDIRKDAPVFRRFVLTGPAILANKLTTIVGRAEERDLVDLLFLERAGFRVEDGLDAALAKDGGCTPATLAWILSELTIPDGIELPGKVEPAELRWFVANLIRRLRAAALPREPGGAPAG
jgi:hypothetical protein